MRFIFAVISMILISSCTKKEEQQKLSEVSPPTGSQRADKKKEELSKDKKEQQASAQNTNAYPQALLLSYARFKVENGKVTAKPEPALLEILRFENAKWKVDAFEDASSNVFHKAMFFADSKTPSILTFGAMDAAVKSWVVGKSKFEAQTIWTEKFGGKFNRMRDAEFVNLDEDSEMEIAVGTHDQGVVAWLDYQKEADTWKVNKIDRQKNTFIHEIEIGDLDKNGVAEIYATPSEPNKLAGGKQHGQVVRYSKDNGFKREIVADMGNRHAKEILVDDVDGDGQDELYIVVEALTDGAQIKEPVEIRRIDQGAKDKKGIVIGRIQDRLCRFLTAGDVDGDGKKELIAAAFTSGVWMLSPGKNPKAEWSVESIDRDSSGFEHAALLADLDADGKDELYVAADNQGEIRQYRWVRGRAKRQTIHKWEVPNSRLTWNITTAPVDVLGKK